MPNDVKIAAKCLSEPSNTIASEDFSVAAYPKNFEIISSPQGPEMLCFVPGAAPNWGVGDTVGWKWESDSGKTADLDLVEIKEKYMADDSPGYNIVVSGDCSWTEPDSVWCICRESICNVLDDYRNFNINAYPVGNRVVGTAFGGHDFICPRTGVSEVLDWEAITSTVMRYTEKLVEVTIQDSGACVGRCDQAIAWNFFWWILCNEFDLVGEDRP